MRTLFRAMLLAISLPAAAATQAEREGGMELSAQPVADSLLVWILNSAAQVPIDSANASAYLYPRLYGIPIEGACVEDTHMVCTHRYFLAVGEYDLLPRQAVFDLGEVGQIVRARVMIDRGPRHPQLKLTVQNYPAHAFQYNPKLVRETRTYSVELDLETLRIAPEP